MEMAAKEKEIALKEEEIAKMRQTQNRSDLCNNYEDRMRARSKPSQLPTAGALLRRLRPRWRRRSPEPHTISRGS